MATMVVGGSACGEIGSNLAKLLKAKYFRIEKKDFPDGEFVVKVPFDAKGNDVIIVQSTYAPQDRHIMELIFIADALKDMHAKSITAVVPYLAYMRQDKRFLNGQVVSSHMIMRLLNAAGIGRLVTVQPHKEKPLSLFKGRVDSIMPIRALMKRVSHELSDPYVLAPDIGGLELAKTAAKILGCGYTHLDKERNPLTGIPGIKKKPHERFDGKQVVIVDDMVSTGTTIMLASRIARENKAIGRISEELSRNNSNVILRLFKKGRIVELKRDAKMRFSRLSRLESGAARYVQLLDAIKEKSEGAKPLPHRP